MFRSARCHGFSLVELLTVTAVVGMMLALLLPAVQKAREAANRAMWKNNFKQVGIALHAYHDRRLKLPTGLEFHVRNPMTSVRIVEGRYAVEQDGGLPVGDYRVRIESQPTASADGEGRCGSNDAVAIPERFNARTELTASIPPASPAVVGFHLKD
jgi:prepilin-type N-terminal cleavage/methylation domain-containing protein